MKLLSKIIFLLTLYFPCFASITSDIIDYRAIIQPCAIIWRNTCIEQLSTEEIVTITDIILLSYQVVQASVIMSQARLTIQSELFNLITLSINDTFDVRLQAQNNDLTNIKHAVTAIEDAQEKIKFACNALKKFGPLIININPTVIQTLISNLKSVILNWAKNQQETVMDLEQVKEDFVTTTHLFSNIKNIYDTINTTDPVEHSHLLHGANSLTDMYKKTENMLADLTVIRQESIANFDILLTMFFKYHYQVLYNQLQEVDSDKIKLIATADHKLPHPDQIFILA